MIQFCKRHGETIVVAAFVAALTAGGPAIADGVRHALFAHDSAKLQDKSLPGVALYATRSDIEVEHYFNTSVVYSGEKVTFEVRIKNNGPGVAQGVDLMHTLSEGVAASSVSSSEERCIPGDEVAYFQCFDVPSKLLPGDTKIIKLTYRIGCSERTYPGATARATAWQFDPDEANDRASTSVTCLP